MKNSVGIDTLILVYECVVLSTRVVGVGVGWGSGVE